jgi:hypothetical protein
MNIQIDGLSERQKKIASLLWDAQTEDEVSYIVERFGRDAESIKHLILYACIDDSVASIQDCKQATEILSSIFNH